MSSYVESVIGSGEEIEYEAKVSLWSMLPLFLLGLLFIWVYGLGLIFWAIAFLRYTTTELVITNKKIISKFGFIKRDTIELLLPKIESIQVNQSIFGRILNYGSMRLLHNSLFPNFRKILSMITMSYFLVFEKYGVMLRSLNNSIWCGYSKGSIARNCQSY